MPQNLPLKVYLLKPRFDFLVKITAFPITIFFLIANMREDYILYIPLFVIGLILLIAFLKSKKVDRRISLFDTYLTFFKCGYWQKRGTLVKAQYGDIYSISLSKNTTKRNLYTYELLVQLVDSDGDYTDCLWTETLLLESELFELKNFLISKAKINLKHKEIIKSWGWRSSYLEFYERRG